MIQLSSVHRLRGHINLKLCLALTSIAFAGVFIVQLPAQDDRQNIKSSESECLNCGTSMEQRSLADKMTPLSKPVPALGPFRLARTGIPQGVTLRGAIRGTFVEPETNKQATTVIDINDSSGYGLIGGTLYEFDLIASSDTANLYGLTLGNAGKIGTASRVALTSPAKVIHLRGEIEAVQLLGNGPQLRFATAPQTAKAPHAAGKEEARDGVRFGGVMSGQFLNFKAKNGDKDRIVVKALDALALGDHGLLAADYVLATTFTSDKADIYGAALGTRPDENLLRVDVDTPQLALFVQSAIQGARFSSIGLGWGVSKSLDASVSARRAALNGTSRLVDAGGSVAQARNLNGVSSLPKLQGKAFFRAYAQTSPPTPAPTRPPMGGSISIGGGSSQITFPISFNNPIRIGPITIGSENPATGSSAEAVGDATWGTLAGAPGTVDACRQDYLLEQPGMIGNYINSAPDDTASLNANQNWKTRFTPQGRPELFTATIPKGQRNVGYRWTQRVSTQAYRVVITYQRGTPIEEPVTVVTYYGANPNIQGGEPCPTPTPTPAPTATPTPAPKLGPNDGCPEGQVRDEAGNCVTAPTTTPAPATAP